MFAVDGRVAQCWTFTGTHEGEMMGVEPTGKRIEVSTR
jgi:predicted ester cyclase